MNEQIIVLGADHGGFQFLSQFEDKLKAEGIETINCGPHQLDPNDDYPQYSFAVGEQVSALRQQGKKAFGILLCRSGAGVTIAANKVAGIRASQAFSEKQVVHARENDDVNVLTLSGDWLSFEEMWQLVTVFISTPFSGEERHQRRIDQIADYESA